MDAVDLKLQQELAGFLTDNAKGFAGFDAIFRAAVDDGKIKLCVHGANLPKRLRADGRLGAAGFANADRGLAELRLEVGDDLVGLIQIALQSLNLLSVMLTMNSGGVNEIKGNHGDMIPLFRCVQDG